ncbi:MAG: hypothetical protein K6E91_05880 [Butyrivibrio sp.]|nr:hypothetical protein [Butyrivibrio sp.]
MPGYDDALQKKNPYALDKEVIDDINKQLKSKEAEDLKNRNQETKWLSDNLEKLLQDEKKKRQEQERERQALEKKKFDEEHTAEKHTEGLKNMLSAEKDNMNKRQLVSFPTKSVLAPAYNERFRERLTAAKRIEKQADPSSELYQKDKNRQMLIGARDNYSRACIKNMETLMEGRAVTCEGAEYKDLAQFIGTSAAAFSEKDKISLLDCYLGTSMKKGPGGYEGQDRQKALDLMTKALFSIDLSSIKLDSDISFVMNATRLESVMGMVVAYEHMLVRYETSDKEEKVHTYFDELSSETAEAVKEQLDKLRIVSLYYVNRRDIITNNYYAGHQNNEISLKGDDALANQKALAQKLLESQFIGHRLMETYGAGKEVIAASGWDQKLIESNLTKNMIIEAQKLTGSKMAAQELQREKLEEAFKSMDYFGINGFGIYTSEAVRSSTGFAMLFFAMNDLERNSGFFDINSFEMKLVKKHLGKVKTILGKTASRLGFYDAKCLLTEELSELVGCCEEYMKVRKGIASSGRYESVVKISEASASCLKFMQSLSEEQFETITKGKEKAALSDVFSKSDMIVDRNRSELSESKKVFLRNQKDELADSFAAAYGRNSRFRNYGTYMRNINGILDKAVDEDKKSFIDHKNTLLQNYDAIIKLGNSYIKGQRPSMSAGVNRCSIAREAVRNAREMMELIRRLSFADLKNRGKNGLSFKNALFGEDIVNMYEVEVGREIRTRVRGGSSDTVFTADKDVINTNRYKKAISFVGGDTTMLSDYKATVYKKVDGSIVTGLSYNPTLSNIPQGHIQGKFRYVTAKEIEFSMRKNNLNVVYSENALKQLTTIRIMDTIFGKTKRDINTLQYNAATQPVLGEMTIVISSVLNTSNDGYFGRTIKANAGQDNPNEKNVSILDENGDLNIGAYDRTVADRIMSLSAEGCFAEFEKDGIALTEEEKAAFSERLSRVQAAFLKDKTDENGWRNKRDKRDENLRLSRIEDAKGELEKYRRWTLKDDSDPVKKTEKKIKDLKVLKVRDEDGIYNSSLKEMHKQGKAHVLVKDEFMNRTATVEEEATLDKEAEKNKKASKKGPQRQRVMQEMSFLARRKILQLREEKSKFRSVSDKYRMHKKDALKKIVKPLTEEKTKLSPEFKQIIDLFRKYANMDVTVVNGMKETDLTSYMPKYMEDYYKQEGDTLLNAKKLSEERLAIISGDTKDEALIFEREKLLELKKLYDEMMAGKLEVPENKDQIIVVEDSAFVDFTKNKITNVVTIEAQNKMTLRRDEPLFTHEPCANDIAQGYCGDCYLLATIAAVVEKNPDYVRKMMVDNGNGTVTVRLFGPDKQAKYVTVTKSTVLTTNKEVDRGGDKFVQGALWVKMLEKAVVASGLFEDYFRANATEGQNEINDRISVFEQLRKNNKVSYEAISGGDPAFAAGILLGTKGSKGYFESKYDYDEQLSVGVMNYTDEQKEFLEMAEGIGKKDYFMKGNKNYALTVSTLDSFDAGEDTKLKTHDQERGMYVHHVYTVLGVRKIGSVNTVVLRNPHGAGVNRFSYNENTGAVSSEQDKDVKAGGDLFVPVNTFFRMFKSYQKIEF